MKRLKSAGPAHDILMYQMKEPLITVIIPVYNVEPYIRECLDSVLSQTYSNLEVLAVNDGSTDQSMAVLEVTAFDERRLTILDKPNGGLSDARNYGLAHAHGEYVCFIDGDDTIAPTFVKSLYTAIKNGGDIAVCDMEYVYGDGRREFSSGGTFAKTNVKSMPSLIRINNSACNKLYRTSLFDEVQFPKGKLYEDLATVPIQLYRSQLVCKVDQPLYFYRQRAGSIQHKIDRRVFHIYDAIDRCRDYVMSNGNEPAVLEEIYHMYVIFGLDITTVKIKDMEHTREREEMLGENIRLLNERYPDYTGDSVYRAYGLKKRLIFFLLEHGKYKMVLRIYDR